MLGEETELLEGIRIVSLVVDDLNARSNRLREKLHGTELYQNQENQRNDYELKMYLPILRAQEKRLAWIRNSKLDTMCTF